MGEEGLDATFGEELAAGFAGVLITVGIVLEFGASVEVFTDQGIRLTSHPEKRRRLIVFTGRRKEYGVNVSGVWTLVTERNQSEYN